MTIFNPLPLKFEVPVEKVLPEGGGETATKGTEKKVACKVEVKDALEDQVGEIHFLGKSNLMSIANVLRSTDQLAELVEEELCYYI
jgi:hypothetical protein